MARRSHGSVARVVGRILAICVASATIALASYGQERPASSSASSARQPNILLIVADDLGFADVGAFGGEIPTPTLDALAQGGMMLTRFYAGMTCSPTRAMLMSGIDNHLAGLGVMGRPRREDQQNQPGYLGYLNGRVATLAEILSDAGYNTYMTGKWHLGSEVDTGPRARGFKRSFVSLDGAAHLGPWDWRGPQLARYRDGDDLVHVDESFYSTRFYTERMIEYIEQDRDTDKPFFAYLAYTAPHWPLQAPQTSIEKFKGRYDAGYEALYAQRFERQKTLGLIDRAAHPVDNARFDPPWSALSEDEKKIEARHMEIFAAMVNDLDTYIGTVIAYLESIGEYDNTLIVFMSDNGPEPGRMDLSPAIQRHVGVEYDHSLENLGSATSYVNYGRNWASASASPFYRHKFTAFEGGVHVPAFVHYAGRVAPGSRSDAIATVVDLLPTFLDAAGTEHPGPTYRGRDVLMPQGRTLLPVFRGRSVAAHAPGELFGWELFGQRAVRTGDWKLVWDNARPPERRDWQLFDLADDPSEQHDLSAEYPAKRAELLDGWERYDAVNHVIY